MRKELNEVHLLRGIASLGVCFFHLVHGNNAFPFANTFKDICSFGYLGVEVFFILSAYVICYSFPPDFSFYNLRFFFLKRIVRIEPPYLASILLVLVLNAISYKITGTANQINWLNILYHVGYLNNFGLGTYINPIYWTLGIELQFYLLIGLLFPLLRRSFVFLLLGLSFLLTLTFIPVPVGVSLITTYLSFFALGIAMYFYKIAKRISLPVLILILLIFGSQIYFFPGINEFLASLFTIVILFTWTYSNKVILFFSRISYSLYLVHVPIGGKVINLGLRYIHTVFERYLLVFLAVAAAIICSYLFYLLIEKPFLKLSKKIVYKRLIYPKNFLQKNAI